MKIDARQQAFALINTFRNTGGIGREGVTVKQMDELDGQDQMSELAEDFANLRKIDDTEDEIFGKGVVGYSAATNRFTSSTVAHYRGDEEKGEMSSSETYRRHSDGEIYHEIHSWAKLDGNQADSIEVSLTEEGGMSVRAYHLDDGIESQFKEFEWHLADGS